jgi:ABC-2 type transport system permease protein
MGTEAHVEEGKGMSSLQGLGALTKREIVKWYRTPFLLIISLVQPIIWLSLFGRAMDFGTLFRSGALEIPVLNLPKQVIDQIATQLMKASFGTADYFSFFAVGQLSFIVVFSVMFGGMSLIWDRRLGILDKLLSTPVERAWILLAKVLSNVVRALAQGGVVLLVAVLLGMNLSGISVMGIVEAFSALALLGFGLASLFVMLAVKSTNWQTQAAIGNLLNLPLLFTSNALFPIKYMPEWLQYVAKANPITYATDACRQLLLGSQGMASLPFDFLYLTLFSGLLASASFFIAWRLLSSQ